MAKTEPGISTKSAKHFLVADAAKETPKNRVGFPKEHITFPEDRETFKAIAAEEIALISSPARDDG